MLVAPAVGMWTVRLEAEGFNAPTAGFGTALLDTALVDAACREVGRDPAEIERTVAAFVELPGAVGARDFDRDSAPPITGGSGSSTTFGFGGSGSGCARSARRGGGVTW